MRDASYFTDHTIGSETARVYEHEFLISFNNDSGAYAFDEWWRTTGRAQYESWVNSNLNDLNDTHR